MPKFKHKPIEIDAIKAADALRFASRSWKDLPKWLQVAYEKGNVLFGASQVLVVTAQGHMTAGPNDWITCGITGELYPCPAEVIEKAYDRVD